MRKIIGLFICFAFAGMPSFSYGQQVPEQYINAGLNNNLVLLEKKVDLEKSLLSLKVAKSMFLPTTWLEGQYSLAKGGRSIDIPVGDLVNPVYKTLNQLTGTNGFPIIQNVSEQLLPNNFYDVRVRTTMPLLNPDLAINRQIRQQQNTLQQNEIDIYKRELVKEIKTAYYNHLQSGKSVLIFKNALQVVRQNLLVNQSMLRNGKGLYAYVSRAESEVQQVESQLQNAVNATQNAKAYFNFLLNRPLTDFIILLGSPVMENDIVLPAVIAETVKNREELLSLNIAGDINRLTQKMSRSYRTPRVNAFVDLASQAFNFKVNKESFFYLAGLQLQFPIFNGKRNIYATEQAQLEGNAVMIRTDQTRQQLELAALVSRNNAITAYNTHQASIKQQQAAQQYFKLISKGYNEGINPFIEYLDARNQLTNAELQTNINYYKVLIALADYERQISSYSFK